MTLLHILLRPMHSVGALLFVCTVGLLAPPLAAGAEVIAKLELHYGPDRPLSEGEQAALQSTTLRFLRSSNFNSQSHRDILKTTPVRDHAAYRKMLAGRYLVVTFGTPQQIRTVGGDLVVLEIVVGLNRQDYADSLFTIDAEGRVVSHAKYSGALCIEFLEEVRKPR